ncbi:MAG: alpha/beta fold hydrolase [Thermoplasmata archaeon]
MISENIESLKDIEIHYLKNGFAKSKVLLLHGYSFNANTWKDLKTIEILEDKGFGTIALDFPGFGKSERLKGLNYSVYPLKSDNDIKISIEFLEEFIEKHFNTVSIVGPSMGAHLAINYLINHPSNVDKLILIGPVGFKQKNTVARLKNINNQVLIMRGERDSIASEQDVIDLKNMIKNSIMIQYPNAGHPCYLDVPDLFHRDLLEFLRK